MINADVLNLANRARKMRIEIDTKSLAQIEDAEERAHAEQAARLLLAVEALLTLAAGCKA